MRMNDIRLALPHQPGRRNDHRTVCQKAEKTNKLVLLLVSLPFGVFRLLIFRTLVFSIGVFLPLWLFDFLALRLLMILPYVPRPFGVRSKLHTHATIRWVAFS